MKNIQSPFPVNGYSGPEFFCDRVNELGTLENYLKGHIPVVIIGVRRLGKSGLIRHFFNTTEFTGVYVDLQKSSSLNGLVNALAEGIGRAFPENKYRKVWSTLKSFRPSVTFDQITGSPQFSFNIQKIEQVEQTLNGLLSLLNERQEPIVLALDEFQEITNYPEQNVEGILRAHMQQFSQLRYLFSGSSTNLLSSMFSEGGKPFYANTSKLYLQKIEKFIYQNFIQQQFQNSKKDIDSTLINEILDWSEVHTYYTQFVCNQVFLLSKKKVLRSDLEKVQWQILQNAKHDFFQLKGLLSPGQLKLTYAVAKEEDLFNPTSNYIRQNYELGNSNGIMKNLDTLVNKQLINKFFTEEGEPYYKLSNVFIMRYVNGYL